MERSVLACGVSDEENRVLAVVSLLRDDGATTKAFDDGAVSKTTNETAPNTRFGNNGIMYRQVVVDALSGKDCDAVPSLIAIVEKLLPMTGDARTER